MIHGKIAGIILAQMGFFEAIGVILFAVFGYFMLYGLFNLLYGGFSTKEERKSINEYKKKQQLELMQSRTTQFESQLKTAIQTAPSKLKSPDEKMTTKFSNFISFYVVHREIFKMEFSKFDGSKLEFKFPIITFGNIMGTNFWGIENKNGTNYLYLDCVSIKGHKITGKRIPIYRDQSNEEYNANLEELMIYLLTETEYRLIGLGQI